jgi:hypothetical protein
LKFQFHGSGGALFAFSGHFGMVMLSGSARRTRGRTMKDYQNYLEKDAAECKLISDLATDKAKQELFDRLAEHLSSLAAHVELEMLHHKPGKKDQSQSN